MNVSVEIEITKPKEIVWSAITDIQNSGKMISGIISVEVLNTPPEGLVGLKWKEKRVMFGKEAAETMWITEAVENTYYYTRAESHGSVYITKLAIKDLGSNSLLGMSFTGEAQTLFTKILSTVMGAFIKGSMKKALMKDLKDIKLFVESS